MFVTNPAPAVPNSDERAMTRTYLLVFLVEAVVIVALWTFSRYFG